MALRRLDFMSALGGGASDVASKRDVCGAPLLPLREKATLFMLRKRDSGPTSAALDRGSEGAAVCSLGIGGGDGGGG